MATFEIPLTPGTAQTFRIELPAGVFQFAFAYVDTQEGGWTMDISDVDGVPLACGIPLVTGSDLLAPYAYLGLGGGMFVRSDGIPDQVPTFANLGVGAHLYFVTP